MQNAPRERFGGVIRWVCKAQLLGSKKVSKHNQFSLGESSNTENESWRILDTRNVEFVYTIEKKKGQTSFAF